MDALLQISFLAGALPMASGILVLVILAPKPHGLEQHCQALSRYMMAAGASFGACEIVYGWVPPWEVSLLMAGLGLGMTLHARQTHLLAKAAEHFSDGQDSGV